MCMITIVNKEYCKKILFLNPKQSHPEQYHLNKEETFFVIFGKVKLIINKKIHILKKGMSITIPRKAKHSFRDISKKGTVIEEISSFSNKEDSYYTDQNIQQNIKRKSFITIKL